MKSIESSKFCALVLHYKRLDLTIECIHSLLKTSDPGLEIVCIFNGSAEEDLPAIQTKFPSIHIVDNKKNLGFAEGYNRGILYALEKFSVDWLFLINNDATVHPKIFQAARSCIQDHPQAGVMGAKIYFHDEPTLLWYAGATVDLQTWRCVHFGYGDCDLEGDFRKIGPTGYACGCALFVKVEAIKQVGLMEKDFFLIWEEVDWCWRFRKAGYECLFIPEAKVWHRISHSFEEGNRGPDWQYYYFRNRLLFLNRHATTKQKRTFFLKILPKELWQILSSIFHPKTEYDLRRKQMAALQGIYHYFRGGR